MTEVATADVADVEICATMMAASEPWITLGRTLPACRTALGDPSKELYVVRDDAGVAGFVLIDMRGPLSGYIQSICVRPDARGRGLGARLLSWSEERIFRDSPNVFLCVSSFNLAARRLYERLGFEVAGTLRGFVVDRHDEILLRKTRGSWSAFQSPARR